MKNKINIFWFRRDLRLEDNAGFSKALQSGLPVLCLFIFDRNILDRLEEKRDRRVSYIHATLRRMNETLKNYGARLHTYYGDPKKIFADLLAEFDVAAVFSNRDYEPEARQRDSEMQKLLAARDVFFHQFKDQVIFEQSEVTKENGTPYTVYTPYAKKWRLQLSAQDIRAYATDYGRLLPQTWQPITKLEAMGFQETDVSFQKPDLPAAIIHNYHLYRDYPAVAGTTRLGMALRFGVISIRTCVTFARAHNAVWLSELIWREFFMQLLFHFPNVTKYSFKPAYDRISFSNDETAFAAWCAGRTGYPLVDAGMRELNATGFMHNRVRMITASFLTKHLLTDWRWGEAYFAQKLNDYELSANNGNWQWVAGSGCDAAPYFRIFNPTTQAEKFDKDKTYIRQWVPDFESRPIAPVINHEAARRRALAAYAKAWKEQPTK